MIFEHPVSVRAASELNLLHLWAGRLTVGQWDYILILSNLFQINSSWLYKASEHSLYRHDPYQLCPQLVFHGWASFIFRLLHNVILENSTLPAAAQQKPLFVSMWQCRRARNGVSNRPTWVPHSLQPGSRVLWKALPEEWGLLTDVALAVLRFNVMYSLELYFQLHSPH